MNRSQGLKTELKSRTNAGMTAFHLRVGKGTQVSNHTLALN